MGSVSGTKRPPHVSSTKPAFKRPKTLPPPPENPAGTVPMAAAAAAPPPPIDVSEEDAALGRAEVLTREEVLRRRLWRVRRLEKWYRDQYWCLMEEVRRKYREYYWKYGKSPFVEEEDAVGNGGGIIVGSELGLGEGEDVESGGLGIGFGEGVGGMGGGKRVEIVRCVFAGCKTKAMALTKYCHAHILSDSKQVLYKPCTYVIKSAQMGPVTCGKPVLRAAVPSLCSLHLQKAQKNVSQALKKAGFDSSSSSRPAPKFHILIAEYVRLIQDKRRELQRAALEETVNGDHNIK